MEELHGGDPAKGCGIAIVLSVILWIMLIVLVIWIYAWLT